MSFWSNALSGIAGGFRDGALAGLLASNGHQGPSIESLCAAIPWQIDEQDGRTIGLHFRNSQGGLKKVFIVTGDGPSVLMAAHSEARILVSDMPPELFAYLAKRNGELGFAAWQAYSAGEDRIGFMLAYTALAHGLTPPIFKHLCECLAEEAADFDGKLEKSGLLSS